jgi:hypothetical protein
MPPPTPADRRRPSSPRLLGAWRRIVRFGALPARDRGLFLLAAGALPLTALGLHLCGLRRCHRGLERLAGRPARARVRAEAGSVEIRRTVRLHGLAVRHGPFTGNCLSRSLVLWWLLRRQGIQGDLRIGTRLADGRLEGHAWVEYRGHPLGEPGSVRERYAVFRGAIPPPAKPAGRPPGRGISPGD